MSRNFAVLGKLASERPFTAPSARGPATSREYSELVRRLFHSPAAVAVVGVDSAEPMSEICISIATEVAASNRRVLVVSVETILSMDPISIPDNSGFTPASPNVWMWQSPTGPKLEIFRSETSDGASWLDALRRSFDFILLDCSFLQVESGAAQVATAADKTLLVVHESQTEKQKIRGVQRSLQFAGATLTGSILVRQR